MVRRGGEAGAVMGLYSTIEGRATAEITEKKSRFIAHLAHVETEDAALQFLEEIRSRHVQARHNVYAYILRGSGASERIRYSDDGEPSGTSGMPTLQTLQHAELSDVVCVTTRYFGGTLLGTGGLVRAYTQAAQAAIDAATIVRIDSIVDVSLTVPYSLYEQVQRTAEACQAKAYPAEFAEAVSLKYKVLAGCERALIDKLKEVTKGQVSIEKTQPYESVF